MSWAFVERGVWRCILEQFLWMDIGLGLELGYMVGIGLALCVAGHGLYIFKGQCLYIFPHVGLRVCCEGLEMKMIIIITCGTTTRDHTRRAST